MKECGAGPDLPVKMGIETPGGESLRPGAHVGPPWRVPTSSAATGT